MFSRLRTFLVALVATLLIISFIAIALPVKAGGRMQEDIPTPTSTFPSTMPSHLPKITTSNASQLTLLGVPHGPGDWITGISFSPNNILAVSDFEGQIYLWDATTLQS